MDKNTMETLSIQAYDIFSGDCGPSLMDIYDLLQKLLESECNACDFLIETSHLCLKE